MFYIERDQPGAMNTGEMVQPQVAKESFLEGMVPEPIGQEGR
jgi:hypothetical protein